MTPLQRRALLGTQANPSPGADFLVTLEAEAVGGALTVTYVPDRLLLDRADFAAYLAAVTAQSWPALEALGVAMRDDLGDVLVPRWLRVSLRRSQDGLTHSVRLEDRQPRWNNEALLAGL
jgi:hypothetical protein